MVRPHSGQHGIRRKPDLGPQCLGCEPRAPEPRKELPLPKGTELLEQGHTAHTFLQGILRWAQSGNRKTGRLYSAWGLILVKPATQPGFM